MVSLSSEQRSVHLMSGQPPLPNQPPNAFPPGATPGGGQPPYPPSTGQSPYTTPPPAGGGGGGGAGKVVLIVLGILGVMALLCCGGLTYLFYQAKQGIEEMVGELSKLQYVMVAQGFAELDEVKSELGEVESINGSAIEVDEEVIGSNVEIELVGDKAT
ncbi:MAG: hypothetical protein AAFP90_03150, partial [Planctomycetota bacterium]